MSNPLAPGAFAPVAFAVAPPDDMPAGIGIPPLGPLVAGVSHTARHARALWALAPPAAPKGGAGVLGDDAPADGASRPGAYVPPADLSGASAPLSGGSSPASTWLWTLGLIIVAAYLVLLGRHLRREVIDRQGRALHRARRWQPPGRLERLRRWRPRPPWR